ncbi:MAG: penicillin-binding protein 2 [Actinobacteria bacterium]|nr:penicillin-binding protein 2 [Actinomycetota bacterium]
MSGRRTSFYRLPDAGSQGLTSQASLRIALLGTIALALFAIVFFRLWFLQVLSGDRYLAEANSNRVRDIRVEAPRGEIRDRNGFTLVHNRGSWQVQVDRRRWGIYVGKKHNLVVSDGGFAPVLTRLSSVLGEPRGDIKRRIEDSLEEIPFANPTAAIDVSYKSVVAIRERQSDFPGVSVTQTFERDYPHGNIGAHLFGYVREVSGDQLKSGDFEGAKQSDRVGQDGLELTYDRYLRGRSGTQRIQVDVADRQRGQLPGVKPRTGDSLRLTLDLGVQEEGERALRLAAGGYSVHGGAFVAMDVRDGAIRGMGSFPTFDPDVYTGVLKRSTYRQLTSKSNGAPLTNRAIAALYPAGSTFKPITAVACLESGISTPGTVIVDGGKMKVGNQTFENAGEFAYGPVDLASALKVSSDVYFYTLGQRAGLKGGNIIQKWATRLGVGRQPGIDLPGAAEGLVPTPQWRNEQRRKLKGDPYRPEPWTLGHNVQLAIGQGDLQTNPLQMAVAYAAIANGGYVVRPHLGLRIDNATGQVIQDIDQPARRRVNINPRYRKSILDGLYAAANLPGGTSADVFAGFPRKVAGKTGTVERVGQRDQSWYVALAPYPNPRYVVAVTVEQGGFGAETAAPAARLILAKLLGVKGKQQFVRGKSRSF